MTAKQRSWRLATWNVNSLRVRLPHLLDWLQKAQPDCIGLQETKVEDSDFPYAELEAIGYHAVHSGQRSYNGVALLARTPLADVEMQFPAVTEDPQRRVIAGTCRDVRVVCAYVPNGQTVGSEKYAYKLHWIKLFREWLASELERWPRLAIIGDFNIAPEPRDVHDPDKWEGQIHFSEPERDAFQRLLGLGLVDAFRLFDQPARSFSWWDYRLLSFRRKWGLRIDHILLSPALAQRCTASTIDVEPRRLERPSDHAPVIADFAEE